MHQHAVILFKRTMDDKSGKVFTVMDEKKKDWATPHIETAKSILNVIAYTKKDGVFCEWGEEPKDPVHEKV